MQLFGVAVLEKRKLDRASRTREEIVVVGFQIYHGPPGNGMGEMKKGKKE